MKLEKVTSSGNGGKNRWYDDACGTALALEFVGERWSLLIMRELMFGPRRFGELRANLPGVSANVLTQRLAGLEEAGIVVRRRLPSPANVQVYDLTAWGRETEGPIRELGRWAARSPRHDPLLFMSAASAMISLQTLIDPLLARAGGTMTVAFLMPDDAFVARLEDGELTIARGTTEAAHATLIGDTMALRRTIYGKRGFGGDCLTVEGDRDVAQAFVDLFALPAKVE